MGRVLPRPIFIFKEISALKDYMLTKRRRKGLRIAMEERAQRQQRFSHRGQAAAPHLREPLLRLLAPNLDQLLIVTSLASPAPSLGLVDRLLVLAQAEDVRPLVVFTKLDLCAEPAEVFRLLGLYRGLGFPALAVSSHAGVGLEELRAELTGKTSALSGHSGVGKSSLLRALFPALEAEVGSVSEATGKGRHTTTTARLYRVDDVSLFDLPGLKEAPLHGIEDLTDYFPDFTAAARRCRFADCRHAGEPACGVEEAVAQGLIEPERLASYRRML